MLKLKIGDIFEDENGSAKVVEVKEDTVILEFKDGSNEEISIEDLTEEFEANSEEVTEISMDKLKDYNKKSKESADSIKKDMKDNGFKSSKFKKLINRREGQHAAVRSAGKKALGEETVTETTAAETIKTHSSANGGEPKSRLETLKSVVGVLASKSTEELTKLYTDMINQIGHETDKLPSGANSGSNAATIKAKPSNAVREDMNIIFNGTEFSEEFKDKALTLFDSAVTLKITEETVRLEEAYEEALTEAVENIEAELTENLDDYLEYVAEKWLEDNKVAIESTLRNELMDEFIVGLKGLFQEHFIDIPEDKVNVLESVVSEKEELETKYNEVVAENIELMKILEEAAKNEIFDDVKEGLTLIQIEKFRTLAEGIEFADLDTYKAKLEVVKENYFSKSGNSNVNANVEGKIEESVSTGETIKSFDPSIEALAKAIKRTSK